MNKEVTVEIPLFARHEQRERDSNQDGQRENVIDIPGKFQLYLVLI